MDGVRRVASVSDRPAVREGRRSSSNGSWRSKEVQVHSSFVPTAMVREGQVQTRVVERGSSRYPLQPEFGRCAVHPVRQHVRDSGYLGKIEW